MGFDALATRLDYPLFVVTVAAAGGERSGCLVGFATQCSIHPPRALVCISKANHTHRVAAGARLLAVHVLAGGQRDLAVLFGGETGDDTDKFARCRWEPGPEGTPLLTDCPNRFLAAVRDRVDVGDHTAYLLDVVDVSTGAAEPLLTFQQVRDLDPGHEA